MSIYETCKPIFNSIFSLENMKYIIIIIFVILLINGLNLKLLIPYTLIFILYLVIRNINKTHSNGILFIDYFSIRQLDVIFALIFGFIMIVFLVFSIIFAYKQYFDNTGSCHPLLVYLGNTKSCMRNINENFDNQNESFIDKLVFLSKIVKTPFDQIYLGYLAIISILINTITYIKTSFNSVLTLFFKKQTEMSDKVRTIFVEPLMIKITDPLFKIIQLLFDSF